MAGSDIPRESTLTALRLLGALNLHQCLWLPKSDSHERLRVTFSTTNNFKEVLLPAVLFAGPMFSIRYDSLFFSRIAEDCGVRMICIDRPGFGGSSPAPVEQRVSIWLETVRAVLDKLDIKHVSLVSHSAGTIYALNTVYHLRNILDPAAPFVAFFGPWVHQENSGATLWNVVSKLPKRAICSWHNISQFISTKVMPMSSWSGGVVKSTVNMFQAESGAPKPGTSSAWRTYGVDVATRKEIERLETKYVFAEGVTGVDHEAMLCLKKCKPGTWGVCEDYEKYVQDLVRMENEGLTKDTSAAKLKVKIFYAESDFMIGKSGMEYFQKIWNQAGVTDCIDVQSETVAKTDHATVLFNFRKGALRRVLTEIHRANLKPSYMVKVRD